MLLRRQPAGPPPRSRHIILFLTAIVLPSLLLVGLTLRMMAQQRELAGKREADERQRIAAATGATVLAVLDEATRAAVTGDPRPGLEMPAALIALIAPLRQGHIVLPWDLTPPSRSAAPGSTGPYAEWVRAGEHSEQRGRFDLAAGAYRRALETAGLPGQAALGRLGLARALDKRGDTSAAVQEEQRLLSAPLDVQDEHGIPIALYAAHRLLARGSFEVPSAVTVDAPIVAALRGALEQRPELPPAALFMARDLAERLVPRMSGNGPDAADLLGAVGKRIQDAEQAMALQKAYTRTSTPASGTGATERRWELFGPDDHAWLVPTTLSDSSQESTVVAFRLDALQALVHELPGVQPHGVSIVSGSLAANSEPLSSSLPGLGLVFPEAHSTRLANEDRLLRSFYVAALLLVLTLTASGGYFFWRDVQRELRLATLRSGFVSSVSHELKTPLTAIRMFAETLLMQHPQARPEMQEEYLETIVNESERLSRLISNVLDFSKIEQARKTYRLEPQSLGAIVSSAAKLMEYPLAQQGFELRVAIDDQVPLVLVDRDAIEQAILNLLSNAMKYSGSARAIDLRLYREDWKAVIAVRDHGAGVPEHEQARIFQKFYRSPTVETQHIPGTGLGLTIVEHLTSAHGGRVMVESAPGQGSTFFIHLPLRAAPDAAGEPSTICSDER